MGCAADEEADDAGADDAADDDAAEEDADEATVDLGATVGGAAVGAGVGTGAHAAIVARMITKARTIMNRFFIYLSPWIGLAELGADEI